MTNNNEIDEIDALKIIAQKQAETIEELSELVQSLESKLDRESDRVDSIETMVEDIPQDVYEFDPAEIVREVSSTVDELQSRYEEFVENEYSTLIPALLDRIRILEEKAGLSVVSKTEA